MIDPSIDEAGRPFSYFSRPVTMIGAVDSPWGTEITPEGYLYTRFCELVFFLGDPPVPFSQRIKTLEGGSLPVVTYGSSRHGVDTEITAFAATLDRRPDGRLVNFVRVRLRNHADRPRTSYFWVGIRYSPLECDLISGIPRSRFKRVVSGNPWPELAGVPFDYNWSYDMGDDWVARDNKVVFLFSRTGGGKRLARYLTFGEPWDPAEFSGEPIKNITPATPVCLVRYELKLKPGGFGVIDIKMPYRPISADNGSAIDSVRAADFDYYREETERTWRRIFDEGLEIELAEPKVVETFNASLVYQLLSRDKIGDYYVQKVNEFQYDDFFPDAAAFCIRSYDVTGYHEQAAQCIDYLLSRQLESGDFPVRPNQMDSFGLFLWAVGQHAVITGDSLFALRTLPAARRAVRWLRGSRRRDRQRLLSAVTADNVEDLTGHVTGHNVWAVTGMRYAGKLARLAGDRATARDFTKLGRGFAGSLESALKRVTGWTGGYIPPGLDGPGGEDWGNFMLVWPTGVLRPEDGLVEATMSYARSKLQEGLATYRSGEFLHLPLSCHLAGTELCRGNDRKAVEMFYSILVHTSSTHAGFETDIRAWGDRDFGFNLPPNASFAARYRMLLRDMLVRESGDDLVLLSAVSPAWIGPGKTLRVKRAPTDFGVVNFDLEVYEKGALLTLRPYFRRPPRFMMVRVPWFAKLEGVYGDGRWLMLGERMVRFDGKVRRIYLNWSLNPVEMSYGKAVADFKREYARRYRLFLENGSGYTGGGSKR